MARDQIAAYAAMGTSKKALQMQFLRARQSKPGEFETGRDNKCPDHLKEKVKINYTYWLTSWVACEKSFGRVLLYEEIKKLKRKTGKKTKKWWREDQIRAHFPPEVADALLENLAKPPIPGAPATMKDNEQAPGCQTARIFHVIVDDETVEEDMIEQLQQQLMECEVGPDTPAAILDRLPMHQMDSSGGQPSSSQPPPGPPIKTPEQLRAEAARKEAARAERLRQKALPENIAQEWPNKLPNDLKILNEYTEEIKKMKTLMPEAVRGGWETLFSKSSEEICAIRNEIENGRPADLSAVLQKAKAEIIEFRKNGKAWRKVLGMYDLNNTVLPAKSAQKAKAQAKEPE